MAKSISNIREKEQSEMENICTSADFTTGADNDMMQNKKGALFIRVHIIEYKNKAGKWRKAPNFQEYNNWVHRLPRSRRRSRYIFESVTRQQAVKWLVKQMIPWEFQPDFRKLVA